MQVSPARLNIVRGALVVTIILALFWGIGLLFFPEQMHKIMSKDPFTASVQGATMVNGAYTLTWVVAMIIALRDILRHRGLIKAGVATLVILFVVLTYVAIAVSPPLTPAMNWITNALLIILAVVIGVAYPWGETAT